ncbi:MAG: hypothetical protein HY718_06610 [Planctomycetes bacterium]|nr:hypothetical protein [Planctomycetota bacterium]
MVQAVMRTLAFILPTAALPAAVFAQTTTSAPSEASVSPADRALDDAMQRLFDSIAGLQVDADGTSRSVAGLLAAWPQAERQLRQAVLAHVQTSRPRQPAPGLTAIDVRIPIDRLTRLLQEAMQSLPATDRPQRLRLPAAAGPAVSATGRVADDGRPRDSRAGWRHCTQDDIFLSHRAAEHDLRQRLLARLLRLPLTNRQTVGQPARERPDLDRLLRAQLERLAVGEPALEPTGLCVLTCTLSPGQLSTLVNQALAQAGLAATIAVEPDGDLDGPIMLQGFSTPPPRPPPAAGPPRLGPRPAWADQVLSKTATASAPAATGDPAERRALAVRAARIEARRQLWLEIENLMLPAGQTVGEAIARRPDAARVIEAIDAATFNPSAPTVDDHGTAKLTVALRLETVWQIVSR